MNKIKHLVRYEFIDLKRNHIFIIMSILYIFGVQQVISNMRYGGNLYLTLIGLQKDSWVPINFLIIPIMYIGVKVGKSENEIFKSISISKNEVLISKYLSILLISFIIFLVNINLFILIGLICRVSFECFVNNFIGYIVNTTILLLVCSNLGLFIGVMINKYVGEVISYLLIIAAFMLFCNFYKEPKNILPLIQCNVLQSNFYVNNYDKGYLYHNILWGLIALTLIIITLIKNSVLSKKRNNALILSGVLFLTVLSCAYFGNKACQFNPTYYDIYSRRDKDYVNTENAYRTFFSNDSCGYYINKYSMDIRLTDRIANKCDIQISINKNNVNSVELGLYGKLNVSEIKIDSKSTSFKRTSNSIQVNLPRDYNDGEVVNMEVVYEGKIDTKWLQSETVFYLGDNRIFLGDVFEWYPKLNDNMEKVYDIQIKYYGKNKIYSNLDEISQNGVYKFTGKDKEVFIISGDMKEVKYKDITIIGNEEYVKNSEYCENMINRMKKETGIRNRIIVGTFVPGGGKMLEEYEKAYFYGGD